MLLFGTEYGNQRSDKMPPKKCVCFESVIWMFLVFATISEEFHSALVAAVSSADVQLSSTGKSDIDAMKWTSLLEVTSPFDSAHVITGKANTTYDASSDVGAKSASGNAVPTEWSVAPVVYEGDKPAVVDIWMIGLFPLKGSWPGGLGQLPAVEMGLEDVNADPRILPGYRLRMTVDDTGVSSSFSQFPFRSFISSCSLCCVCWE